MPSPKETGVALVIIYNHRYDRNIDLLERMYSGRFPDRYHLMPFYDGKRERVIPVYENSLCFQGYVAQGVKEIIDDRYSHYLFIADDAVLNPAIDASNVLHHLRLGGASAFISRFGELHGSGYWRGKRAAVDFNVNASGSEGIKYLPSREDAESRFSRHGLRTGDIALTGRQLFRIPSMDATNFDVRSPRKFLRNCYDLLRNFRRRNETHVLPYPFVGSYSDLFIVPGAELRRFAHLCGIFASMRLFVEVAIPTAMVLSCDDIRTLADTGFAAGALWTVGEIEELEKRFGRDLGRLLDGFPAGTLYIHPVKLSKWRAPS